MRASDAGHEGREQPADDGAADGGQARLRRWSWLVTSGPLQFPPPRPGLPGEARVLQIGIGDARHQRVPVQPYPGPALEVPEPKFAFQLLMRLLAYPAGLDRRTQRAQRSSGRQVGQVELALAGGTPFADQPGLIARQVAVVRPHCAVRHPDAQGGEPGGQRALGALPPRHPPPRPFGQHVLGRA